VVRWYARLTRDESETLASARARLEAWTKDLALPEGVRVAVGDSMGTDEETGASTQTGWRTYLLQGAPVVTELDVVDARALPDPQTGVWSVMVTLGPEDAARFEAFTEKNVKRRLAIVVDGRVMSAPLIQTRIPGGLMRISMGAGPPEQQKAEAQKLARALRGE